MCPPTLAMVQNSGKKQLSCFHDKAATSVTCSFCLYAQHLIAGPTTTIGTHAFSHGYWVLLVRV